MILKKHFKLIKWGLLLAVIFAAVDFLALDYAFQTAPYSLPKSPMIGFRITGNAGDQRYFRNGPGSLHGFAIVQQISLSDPQLQQDLLSALNSRLSYSFTSDKCFQPGIAVRFGQGDDAVDALICLDCAHVYFFKGNEYSVRNLTPHGKARLKGFYPRMFPGHSGDGNDADMEKATELRYEERTRLEEEKYQLAQTASRPASAPAN